jgi:hypothetical protein
MHRIFSNLAVAILFAAGPALAQVASDKVAAKSPTIDFTQYPLDQNGAKAQDFFLAKRGDKPDQTYPDLTLGAAACHALNAPTQDEQNLQWEERFRRGTLCQKIKGNVTASLEAGDIDLIKKRVGAVYTDGVFVMNVICAMDPATKGCER